LFVGEFSILPAPVGEGGIKSKTPASNCQQEVVMANIIHKELSYKLINMAYTVHNVLGPGLLESAYEGAMCVELARAGMNFERQRVYPLCYKGEYIGGYIADLVVDNAVILELKSVVELNKVMEAQIINYLKLSKVPVGYLINFNGLRVDWRRFVYQRE
jgi:GxxExxY protein